jgi:NADH dehydrogenase
LVGATGLLGGEVCRRLSERGERVRALVRPRTPAERRAELERLGAALVEGDLERPETLAACLEGAAAVVSTASAFPRDPRPDALDRVDRDGQLALVDAAARAGVGRCVYVSFPPIASDFPFQRAKRLVEERLAAAGVDHVILQPGRFLDVWFSPPLGFDLEARKATLYGGGTAPQSWVAVADVAEAAVRALRAEPGGTPIAFGGPRAVAQRDVVAAYEAALGLAIATETVPVAALEAMRAGATGPTEESLAAILLSATEPDVIDPAPARERLGLEPTDVEAFVRAQAAARLPVP